MMSVPICFSSKLIQLANSTRSMQGAMFTGLLAFVVLLPLTAASQLACYFIIVGRVDETPLGFWAVFVAILAQMLPCIMLHVFSCFKPAILDTFRRWLPKWSPVLSLIISLSALFWKDWYSIHCEHIFIIHLSFTFSYLFSLPFSISIILNYQ